MIEGLEYIVGYSKDDGQQAVCPDHFDSILGVFPPQHGPWFDQSDDQKQNAGDGEKQNQDLNIFHEAKVEKDKIVLRYVDLHRGAGYGTFAFS